MTDRIAGVITFDCYGTLIDWETGIADAFRSEGARRGRTAERASVLRAYAEAEAEVQRGPYRPYRDVLAEAASNAADRLGWQVESDGAGFLADSLPGWCPFPDTNESLERLAKAGYTLGILSNIDDDLLQATRRHFTVEFDFCITAQQVRSYKPARAHFDAARKHVGSRAWLHAAQSQFHDIGPAGLLGIRAAWIDRYGSPRVDGLAPVVTVKTLSGLVQWLARVS